MTVYEAIKHQLKTKLKKDKGEATEAVQKTRRTLEKTSQDLAQAYQKYLRSMPTDDTNLWTEWADKVTKVSQAAINSLSLAREMARDQEGQAVMGEVLDFGIQAATRFNDIFKKKKANSAIAEALKAVHVLTGVTLEEQPAASQQNQENEAFVKHWKDEATDDKEGWYTKLKVLASKVWTVSTAGLNLLKLAKMVAQHREVKAVMGEVIDLGLKAAGRFNEICKIDQARSKKDSQINTALEKVNNVLQGPEDVDTPP